MKITLENFKSKEWRMDNLYTIIDKYKNKVKFVRNKAQRHYAQHRARRNIILKSRRLGFTTYKAIDMIDECLWTPNFSGLFIAHTQDAAKEIFDTKIDFVWKNINNNIPEINGWTFDKMWKVDTSTANKLKFDFGDGKTFSSIIVSGSGRSGTYNHSHISEFAKKCTKYPKEAEEIIRGTFPSASTGDTDIEGTAEGVGGQFADIFWGSWGKRDDELLPTDFKAHFYNWTWDEMELDRIVDFIPTSKMEESEKFDKYQKLFNLSDREITYYYIKWRELNKDWDSLHQEYPTTPQEAFVASGSPFFENEKVMEYIQHAPQPIETGEVIIGVGEIILQKAQCSYFLSNSKTEIKIWEKPQPYHSYICGGDVAEGKEDNDYSVLNFIDNQSFKTVCKYKGHCRPDELAIIAFVLGNWYNRAHIGIEVNSGLWVNTLLFENLAYENMYFREAIDDITHRVGRQIGFHTSNKTRRPMLDNLKVLLANYPDIWTNVDFLNECLTFVKNQNGRPEAMMGRHDDEVMATAITYFIKESAPTQFNQPQIISQSSENFAKIILENLYGKKQKL